MLVTSVVIVAQCILNREVVYLRGALFKGCFLGYVFSYASV